MVELKPMAFVFEYDPKTSIYTLQTERGPIEVSAEERLDILCQYGAFPQRVALGAPD
jgi:hypothetical protein